MARILVIDDDELVRKTVRGILERAEHAVDEAVDGEDGLRQVGVSRPDLILTDILMPNRDGIEIILKLRKADPEVKIIAMSGGGAFDQAQLLGIARELGADDCIAKPFGTSALISAITACLS